MPRQRISSGGPWEERVLYSRAVRVDDRVWVAGSTGTQPDGSIAPDAGAQARAALATIADALKAAGATLDDVVMARIYLVDVADFDAVAAVLREHLGPARPAMVAVGVAALIDPRMRVEIEVQAVIGSAAGIDES